MSLVKKVKNTRAAVIKKKLKLNTDMNRSPLYKADEL